MDVFEAHSKRFIFFHINCSDGIATVWAYEHFCYLSREQNYHYIIPYTPGTSKLDFNTIYNYKGQKDEIKIERVKAAIEQKIIDLENYKFGSGCDIVFLDCCPPKEVLKKMITNNRSVQIIDHHETNERIIKETIIETSNITKEYDTLQELINDADLEFNPVFDKKLCGAALTWKYRGGSAGISPPWFIQYVDDRDRWVFKLPNSKAINRGMFDANFKKDETSKDKDKYIDIITTTFNNYDIWFLEKDSTDTIEKLREAGQKIIDEETKKIEEKIKTVKEFNIRGQKILGVRCQESTLISELGSTLAKMNDNCVGLTWKAGDKGIKFSLRGIEETTEINLSTFCEQFDGGGHPCASAFFISYEKLIENFFLTEKKEEIKKKPSGEELFNLSKEGSYC